MSEIKPTDQFFNQQLGHYAPEVPAHVWHNIVAARKKKRRGGFWWRLTQPGSIGLMLLLLLAGGAAWWFTGHQPGAGNKEQATVQPAATAVDHHSTTSNKSTALPSATNSTNTISTSDGTDKTKLNTTPTLPEPLSDGVNSMADQANSNPSIPNQPADQSSITTAPGNTNLVTASQRNKKSYQQRSTKKTARYQTDAGAMDTSNDDILDSDAITNTASNNLIDPNTQGSGFFTNWQKIPALPSLYSSSNSKAARQLPNTNIPQVAFPKCPPGEGTGGSSYLEAYAGPDAIVRSLSDTPNSAYLQNRKTSTRMQLSYSAGLRYTHVYNNGLSIRTGINYSQINEKFSYVASNTVQTTYIIDAITGDTTGSYIVRGTRYKTTYNRYRSLDIPVLIGYETNWGNWGANFNAGPVINLYSWQQGDVLDANNQPVNITTGNGKTIYQYKTNIGVGVMAAASFYYKWSPRFQLLAEPYFRYNLSPANSDALTLKLKYNTVGLRLGIRYNLH